MQTKNRRLWRDRLYIWMDKAILPKDYLNDLLTVLDIGGLTGEEIRFINKHTAKRADRVMERITQEYLNRVIGKMNKVFEGDETLILAEQLK